MKVAKEVQIQLTWVEANSAVPEHLPQKTAGGLKTKISLLEFCRKASVRLSKETEKTLEKCTGFCKKMCQVHERCQLPSAVKICDFPNKDQIVTYL